MKSVLNSVFDQSYSCWTPAVFCVCQTCTGVTVPSPRSFKSLDQVGTVDEMALYQVFGFIFCTSAVKSLALASYTSFTATLMLACLARSARPFWTPIVNGLLRVKMAI